MFFIINSKSKNIIKNLLVFIKDFSYQYDSAESKLIILFKGKEEVRMRITEENGVWKLDEH